MKKSLKDYLLTMNEPYCFVIKSVQDFTKWEDSNKIFEKRVDARWGLIDSSNWERKEFKIDRDFPDIEGLVETWEKTISVEYPVDDKQLEELFMTIYNIDHTRFKIRKCGSADVQNNEPKELKNKDGALLLQDEPQPLESDVKAEDLYGDDYNKDMLDKLSSKEYKDMMDNTDEVKNQAKSTQKR